MHSMAVWCDAADASDFGRVPEKSFPILPAIQSTKTETFPAIAPSESKALSKTKYLHSPNASPALFYNFSEDYLTCLPAKAVSPAHHPNQ